MISEIIRAFKELEITPTPQALRIHGLRIVVHQYLKHFDIVSAHRQLTVPKYQEGNRRLAKHLNETYHREFNQACQVYLATP